MKGPLHIMTVETMLVIPCLKLNVQILQAQLKLAENLRKMAEQGKDVEGMDIDLDELRAKVSSQNL